MVELSAIRVRDDRQVFLSDYLLAAAKPAVALGTAYASTPDVTAEWQAAMDAAEALGGATVKLPPGQITINNSTLLLPTNVKLDGAGNLLSKVLIGNGYTGGEEVFKTKYVSGDGSLGNGGVSVTNIWFDGANRIFPQWLTNAAGTPITDPQADYRVGGCLAPTTFASISLGVSGGAVNSVTINSGGSGYVYPPTLWVTGDGYGAIINLTISAGAVTSYSIVDGGAGYTTATAEVAGGGANPATALVAANRRNANWNTYGGCFSLVKMQSPVIKYCRFTNYGGMCILDAGCDGRIVEYNVFDSCGSSDTEAVVLWSQSYGTPGGGQAFFRHTTRGSFRFNEITNCKRSVATIGDFYGDYSDNVIDGWGESCFLVVNWAKKHTVSRNKAKNGTLTDIVCHFVEGTDDSNVFDNIIEGVSGAAITAIGDGANIARNTIIAPTSWPSTYPFGPFSERVGYGLGNAAIAGRPYPKVERCAVAIANASNTPSDAPKAARISGNTLIANDNGNYCLYGVTFSKGAANSIGPVLIDGFDITQSTSSLLFDPVSADSCLDKDKPFRCANNPGHASMGAVLIHEIIASGASGTKKWTFGFRPRILIVNARVVIANQLAHTFAVFVDEEARNPGTSGGTNTSGGITQLQASTVPTIVATSYNQGGLVVSSAAGGNVFNSSPIGFSSDGWSMNITSSTADCIFEVVAIP